MPYNHLINACGCGQVSPSVPPTDCDFNTLTFSALIMAHHPNPPPLLNHTRRTLPWASYSYVRIKIPPYALPTVHVATPSAIPLCSTFVFKILLKERETNIKKIIIIKHLQVLVLVLCVFLSPPELQLGLRGPMESLSLPARLSQNF